jgi:hypothetical protein
MAPWTSASGAVSPSGQGRLPSKAAVAASRLVHTPAPVQNKAAWCLPQCPCPSVTCVACGQQTAQPQRNVKKVKPIKSRACFFHARTCSTATGLAFPLPCTCWLPCAGYLLGDLSFSPHAGDVRGWSRRTFGEALLC